MKSTCILRLRAEGDLLSSSEREPYTLYYRGSLNASRNIEDAYVFDSQDLAIATLEKLNDTWRDKAEICVLTTSTPSKPPGTTG